MSEHRESVPIPTANEVAASMRMPGYDYIYAVIPGPGLVTFHSQQRRAFNLVWSLTETKVIQEGSTVGVVGAGLAGITAAAASGMLGCKVTLFESGLLPFHQQRGNFTRYVHPNILEWPRPCASNAHTSLPNLNWTADRCALVIQEIDAQWKTVPNVEIKPLQEVTQVSARAHGARITVDRPFDQTEYDCVIVCVGFGKEKSFGGMHAPTYWENDALHQVDFSDGQRVLVSGTGDGGLVELMRLMIADFDHGRILEALAAHPPLQALKEDILKAEDRARAGDSSEAGSTLMTAYKTMQIEKSFPNDLRSRIRSNARVTLNGTGDTPYQLSSSILNRVITYVLIKWGIVEYIPGRLLSLQQTESKAVVEFDRKPVLTRLEFDRVVVRHGPVGQLAKLFGSEAAEELRKPTRRISAVRSVELWPPGSFGGTVLSNEYLQITYARAARFYLAFQEVVQTRWGTQASVKIGFDVGHATYLVNVPKTESMADAPSVFARIPVVYESPDEVRIRPDARTSTRRYRPLVCGIGIQNYDLVSREGTLFSGTLGCFVETSDGRPAFLSALHVLAGDKSPNIGDLIVQAPQSTNPSLDGIARLHSFIPLRLNGHDKLSPDFSIANFCDVGLATLLPGVEFVPAFPPEYQLPLPKVVTDTSLEEFLSADEVWIIGSSSGPKRAHISAVAVVTWISYDNGKAMFRDCLELQSRDGSPLNAPGDSGSLVIRDDGSIVGMTFAGNSKMTLAFRLPAVLDALACRLITFSR
jgi:hypothetical protein